MALRSAILCGLIVVFYSHSGEALKCFVCYSALDPLCNDPFPSSHRKFFFLDCVSTPSRRSSLQPPPVCRKLKMVAFNGSTTIRRDCEFSSPVDSDDDHACTKRHKPPLPFGPLDPGRLVPLLDHCSVCYENGCNSANTRRLSYTIYLFISIKHFFL